MEALLARIAAETGLDPATARIAVGHILAFIQKEGEDPAVGRMISQTPGTEEAMASAGATGTGGSGGGGLMGGLMNAASSIGGGGGIMGLGAKLMGLGLGIGEIRTVAEELVAFAKQTCRPGHRRQRAGFGSRPVAIRLSLRRTGPSCRAGASGRRTPGAATGDCARRSAGRRMRPAGRGRDEAGGTGAGTRTAADCRTHRWPILFRSTMVYVRIRRTKIAADKGARRMGVLRDVELAMSVEADATRSLSRPGPFLGDGAAATEKPEAVAFHPAAASARPSRAVRPDRSGSGAAVQRLPDPAIFRAAARDRRSSGQRYRRDHFQRRRSGKSSR